MRRLLPTVGGRVLQQILCTPMLHKSFTSLVQKFARRRIGSSSSVLTLRWRFTQEAILVMLLRKDF